MPICIDRNHNVIINVGGIAHRTGWVAPGYYGPSGHMALARGRGYYDPAGGRHRTETDGVAILEGPREQFTLELFQTLTGWVPENR